MRLKLYILALAVVFTVSPMPAGTAERPLGGTSSMLTPDRLIAVVLRDNPNLAEAEEAAFAAAERVQPAGALDDPVLSYALAPETIGNRNLDTGQRIEVSQLFPWPGKLNARKDAARERASAAATATESRRLTIIAATKAAFAEWYFVHQALRLNTESKRLLENLRAIAESRFAAGRGLQQDVLQTDVEVALLENQRFTLEQQQTAVQARLNRLMNRRPDTDLPNPADLPQYRPLQPLSALTHNVQHPHPELRRLDHLTSEKQADLRLAERERFPDLRFSGGYNSLWDDDEKRITAGVSVNIPLNQSRRRAEESAAHAEWRAAEWRLADRRIELHGAIVRTYAEVERAGKSVLLHRDRLVPLVQNTLDVATAEYESGAGDFLNVITAERNKLKIDQSMYRALADHYRQLAQLELWLGGPIDASSYEGGSR